MSPVMAFEAHSPKIEDYRLPHEYGDRCEKCGAGSNMTSTRYSPGMAETSCRMCGKTRYQFTEIDRARPAAKQVVVPREEDKGAVVQCGGRKCKTLFIRPRGTKFRYCNACAVSLKISRKSPVEEVRT